MKNGSDIHAFFPQLFQNWKKKCNLDKLMQPLNHWLLRSSICLMVALPLFVAEAAACRGIESEDYVLLDALPALAMNQRVVAKVEILKSVKGLTYVKVIESIKGGDLGAGVGATFAVFVSNSSCSWLSTRGRILGQGSLALDAPYWIAGDWQSSNQSGGIFVGSWRGQTKIVDR
jgi:hypothetical protein